MKRIKGLICFLLGFLILLSACNSTKVDVEGTKDTLQNSGEKQYESKELTGRYGEQQIDFPEKIRKVFDLRQGEDGIVRILFEGEPGSIHMYESKDSGITWENREGISSNLLPESYGVKSACFGTEENVFLSAGEMVVNEVSEKQIVGTFKYYEWIESEGQLQELTLNLPDPEEEFLTVGYGLNNLGILANGYLYGTVGTAMEESVYTSYKLLCVDISSGNRIWSMDILSDEFLLDNDSVYLLEQEKSNFFAMETGDGQPCTIRRLNADTGEDSGTYEFDFQNLDCVDFDTGNEKIYYGKNSGIYGVDFKNTLTERLVDGSINSISNTEFTLRNFYRIDQTTFILFMRDISSYDELKILRYEYDPDLTTQPGNELTVYSLKENVAVKKMISDFQSQNPDVYVKYEVGMEGGSVKNVSDAISILNTEIMAGQGPDVLVLNELPWKSYGEKGMLEDMSGELSSFPEEDKVFQNIFSAYQAEGSQYAVPIAFRIPVFIGQQERIEGVESLEDLAKVLENIKDIQPLYRRDKDLLRYIISVNWASVQGEDGTIAKEKLEKLLESARELNDIVYGTQENNREATGDEEPKSYDAFANDSWLNTQGVGLGDLAVDMGYLSTVLDSVYLYNYNLTNGSTLEHVFSPLLVGINGEGNAKDMAKEFIRFTISEEEQQTIFQDMYAMVRYLPINKVAFHNMIQRPEEDELNEMGKGFEILGLEYRWPEESWFRDFEERIEGLTTPTMEDGVVMDTVIEFGLPYMKGDKNLDTAVNEITQKLELYSGE